MSRVLVLTAAAVLLSTLPLAAQESRASISGRVVDSSEAAVVGATVRVANLDTGVVASATTNESGAFRVPFLLPGK